MCSLYFSRNFTSVSFRNISCEMMRSKKRRIRVPFFNYCLKQYSEFKPLSSGEFESSSLLSSRYKIDFQAITEGNEDKIKALKLLLVKLELKLLQGVQLPKYISTDRWRTLLTLSEDEMNDFFQYRFAVETLSESREKEEINAVKYFENTACAKGFFDASILERIPHLCDSKSLQAMQYGPDIVIDCGFEKIIPKNLIWDTAFHLFHAWQTNRIFNNPSHIIYCNLNPDGELFSLIMEMMSDTNQDGYFSFSWTRKTYLEIFPKENMIYLSPESKNIMKNFNGKKIYIIGGLSQHFQLPVTHRKAKLEDIQTASFPLDGYLDGPKRLSVCNCVNILNDLKEGSNWYFAFRHIPKKVLRRHALDENKSPHASKKFKKPTNLIRQKYRSDYLDKLCS